MPPPEPEPDIPAESPWSAENETKNFTAFMAEFTGKVKTKTEGIDGKGPSRA